MAWSGNGWLVAVCNLLGFGLSYALSNFVLVMPQPMHAAVLFFLWCAFSAVGIFFWNRALEGRAPRVLVDAETGQRHEIPADAGTFSNIAVRWWPLINLAVGVAFAAAVLTGVWNPFA